MQVEDKFWDGFLFLESNYIMIPDENGVKGSPWIKMQYRFKTGNFPWSDEDFVMNGNGEGKFSTRTNGSANGSIRVSYTKGFDYRFISGFNGFLWNATASFTLTNGTNVLKLVV